MFHSFLEFRNIEQRKLLKEKNIGNSCVNPYVSLTADDMFRQNIKNSRVPERSCMSIVEGKTKNAKS